MEDIIKYDRFDGVPKNHYCLMHIYSFSDFECPYEDRILVHSENKENIIKYCQEKKFILKHPEGSNLRGWEEFFIKEPRG